jgi:hypothetical protein
MLDHTSVVSGLVRSAIETLDLAKTDCGKTLAVTDGAAALAGYDRDDLIGIAADAAILAGLDTDIVKKAIQAGKARAQWAREYRESMPAPRAAPGAAQEVFEEVPDLPANDNASASLRAALRVQAKERDWEQAATEDAEVASKTGASTIEALLYELRSGLSCLADEGARDRLRRCDEAAMRTIAAELLTRKSRNKPWLPPWLEEDVAKLLDAREVL